MNAPEREKRELLRANDTLRESSASFADNFINRVILRTSAAPSGHGTGMGAFTIPLSY